MSSEATLPSDTTTAPTNDRDRGRRLRELEAHYAIGAVINASLEADDVLRQALQQMMDLFAFPAGVLRQLDPPTGDLGMVAHRGLTPELLAAVGQTVRVGEAPEGLAAGERGVIVIEDLAPVFPASDWTQAGFRTLVLAPFLCRGMLVGCLTLGDHRPRGFDEADRELLSALANQVAMALANTELYSGAQRKIVQLSELHQFSRDIGASLDLPQVLQQTTRRMAQLLRLDRTAILLRDGECSHALVGTAAHGWDEESMRQVRLDLTKLPAAQQVLSLGQSHLAQDAEVEGLLPADFPELREECAVLAIPLAGERQCFGMLIGDRRCGPLRLSPDEMDLAMIFANQASVWIARAQALAEANAAQGKYQDLLELAPDAIVLVDRDGRIDLMNGQAERMFGYGREDLIGKPIETLIPERYRQRHGVHRAGYQHEPRTRLMGSGLELYAARKDGSEFPVEISLSPSSVDGGAYVTAIIRDVTERTRAERERAQLLASEQRKGEQLKLAIREAHHRIKNNLQTVSDLLYLELDSSDGVSAADVLRESVERIQSIALVHDLLTHDEDVQTVDLRALAERLVPMVLRSGRLNTEALSVTVQVPSVSLSSKRATTLSLVLNELVSNAVKHAFAARGKGELSVRLNGAEEGLVLRVEDDGPGLPSGFDLGRDAHVGLQVVRILAERDLGGKLRLSSGPGLVAEVWFPW